MRAKLAEAFQFFARHNAVIIFHENLLTIRIKDTLHHVTLEPDTDVEALFWTAKTCIREAMDDQNPWSPDD